MLEHQHLIVRAEVESPPTCTESISVWMLDLIKDLNMKVLMGPYATYSLMEGNRGLTVAAIIETSHIVLHSWDEDYPYMLQLDVYSCAEVDPNIVWKYMQVFDPIHIDYKFLNRKDKFIEYL